MWGTLPGTTDETIYISPTATAGSSPGPTTLPASPPWSGLADYFSKIPKEKRRRTIVFLGHTGHHNGGNMSGTWLLDHRDEVFAKSALLINCEHTSTMQTYLLGEDIRKANMYTGMLWYAGGPSRPKLQDIAVKAFRAAGVVTYATPERAAPGGEMSRLWPFTPGVQASDYNVFFHSDHESADTVPWTGLEAITRAYADDYRRCEHAGFEGRPASAGESAGSARHAVGDALELPYGPARAQLWYRRSRAKSTPVPSTEIRFHDSMSHGPMQ